MDNINKQIGFINDLMKRHSRYTQFSGIACVITGILWLVNELANLYLHLADNYRVISWIVIALVAIIIAAFLTIYECYKKGKTVINLSLFTIIDKLVIICFSTLVIMWIFYRTSFIQEIPSLLMLMYGTLVLTSRNSLSKAIGYFGFFNFLGGFFGLLFGNYSILLASVILGFGHILLGLVLIFKREN